jgi:hypothetical protein
VRFQILAIAGSTRKAEGRRQEAEGKNLNGALTPPNSWPPNQRLGWGTQTHVPSGHGLQRKTVFLLPSAFCLLPSLLAIAVVSVPKATAQIPFLPQLQSPSSVSNDSNNRVVSDWIYLDGRRLFQIAASKTNFPERSEDIQKKLQKISQNYIHSPANTPIKVEVRKRITSNLCQRSIPDDHHF